MLDKLYRYMSFESFVDIVQSKQLTFVSPIESWVDTYEGTLFKGLQNSSMLEAAADYIIKHGCDPDEPIENLDKRIKRVRCQCWTRAKDDIKMWSIYSYNNKSIMVEIKEEVLSNMGKQVLHYPVNYIKNIDFFEELEQALSFPENKGERTKTRSIRVFRTKRSCYRHEKEVRLFIREGDATDEKKPVKVDFKIDVNEFILGVTVHPYAEDWYVSVIEEYCRLNNIKFRGKSKLNYFSMDKLIETLK